VRREVEQNTEHRENNEQTDEEVGEKDQRRVSD